MKRNPSNLIRETCGPTWIGWKGSKRTGNGGWIIVLIERGFLIGIWGTRRAEQVDRDHIEFLPTCYHWLKRRCGLAVWISISSRNSRDATFSSVRHRDELSVENNRHEDCSTIEECTDGRSVVVTSESYSPVEVVMHWPMDSTEDTLPLKETKMRFQPRTFDWSTGQQQLSEEELLLQLCWGEMGEERGKIRIHIGMKRCTRDGIVWIETKIGTDSEKRVVFQQYLLSSAICP